MPRATQDPARVCRSFRLQGFNLLWPAIPGRSSSQARPYMAVLQPQPAHRLVWASPRSLAATKGISVDFFSYGYLDVSVPRVRSDGLWIQPAVTGYDPCRVAPFGNPRINGCLHLPEAYRSLPRPSSLPRAKASALRPFMLDFYFQLPTSTKSGAKVRPHDCPPAKATCPRRRGHRHPCVLLLARGWKPRFHQLAWCALSKNHREHPLSRASLLWPTRLVLPTCETATASALQAALASLVCRTSDEAGDNGLRPPCPPAGCRPRLRFPHPRHLPRRLRAHLVENTGLEPVTSCLQSRRSPN